MMKFVVINTHDFGYKMQECVIEVEASNYADAIRKATLWEGPLYNDESAQSDHTKFVTDEPDSARHVGVYVVGPIQEI